MYMQEKCEGISITNKLQLFHAHVFWIGTLTANYFVNTVPVLAAAGLE